MKRILVIGAVTALMAVVATAQVIGQDASSEESPLPYAEYVAGLEELKVASRAVFLRLGSAPVATDVVSAYQEVIPLAEADQRRLTEIVPEPCYATAHQEVLAYRRSVIELTEQALPRMAESETLAEVTAILEVMDAELRTRHPSAYLEGPDASGGFGGSYRRILVSLVACDTDAIARAADATSEPGQRVVVQGSYSVTIPGGWLHELEDLGIDGTEEERLRRALGFAPNLWLSEPTGRETCRIEYGPSGGETLESIFAEGRQHSEFDLDYIDLPAGRALRIVGAIEQRGVVLELVGYVMFQHSTRVQIQCAAPVTRDDGWLSIAESLEFLPDQTGGSTSVDPTEAKDDEGASAEGPPDGRFGPDVASGRIERPSDGFAITFPRDWDVEEVSEVGNEWIDEHAENPEGAAVIRQLVWAGDEWLKEQCFVSDASAYAASPPAWVSLKQGVEHEAAAMARWARVEEHESSYLDLPAGRSGLVEVRYRDGSVGQMYIFKRGERWLTLHCEAYVEPRADWLSIAETFEFLPEEE